MEGVTFGDLIAFVFNANITRWDEVCVGRFVQIPNISSSSTHPGQKAVISTWVQNSGKIVFGLDRNFLTGLSSPLTYKMTLTIFSGLQILLSVHNLAQC